MAYDEQELIHYLFSKSGWSFNFPNGKNFAVYIFYRFFVLHSKKYREFGRLFTKQFSFS